MTVLQPDNDGTTIDLMELFFKLLASWKLIVCLAIVLAIAVGVYTAKFVTPKYSATSVIYVLNRDSAINMSDLQLGAALTNDYIRIFSFWEIQEQVISNLDLPYTYKQMRNMLSVTNPSNTRLLDIEVTGTNPEEVAAICNEYANVVRDYIAKNMMTDKPTLMSEALVPTAPVSPSLTKNVIIGFLFGAMLAVGIVTVRMLVDDKYKTAEDIRKYTGIVTLAVIPKDEEITDNKKDKSGKKAKGSGRKE